MRGEWKNFILIDLIEVKHGFAFKGKHIVTDKTENILLTPGNFKVGGGFKSDKFKYYDSDDFPESYILSKDDLLISMTDLSKTGDTLGFPAKIPSSMSNEKYLHNQRLGLVKIISEDIDREYLYWLLRTREYQKFIVNSSTGSTVKHTSPTRILEYGFTAPSSIDEQKKIAHILSTLDDKIELNRKMNQTLETMAQTLFKSWFVDFDPVHVKLTCKSEEELEHAAKELGISKEILDLFPSEFETSELGMIPKGWEISLLKELGRVVTGKTPPNKIEDAYNSSGKPFITPTDVDDSLFITSTNRHLSTNGEISIKNTVIKAGSICVTCIGSQMGKTIISPYDACTNQQINSIIVHSENIKNYLFCNLRNRKNEIFLMGSSGSTMPLLNKSSFEKMKVLLPSQKVLDNFDILIKDKLLLVLKNDLQNITLRKIRDTLLPKLLSGEIDVSELEID